MKLYEVEVAVKITIGADNEKEAKERAVAFVKEHTYADNATWINCKEAEGWRNEQRES